MKNTFGRLVYTMCAGIADDIESKCYICGLNAVRYVKEMDVENLEILVIENEDSEYKDYVNKHHQYFARQLEKRLLEIGNECTIAHNPENSVIKIKNSKYTITLTSSDTTKNNITLYNNLIMLNCGSFIPLMDSAWENEDGSVIHMNTFNKIDMLKCIQLSLQYDIPLSLNTIRLIKFNSAKIELIPIKELTPLMESIIKTGKESLELMENLNLLKPFKLQTQLKYKDIYKLL